MKRYILSIMAMMTMALTTNAMSFTQAQREALFLTDKMAYELNLTDEQYDACYEINLDYLMGVSTVDDLYGTYWTRRNLDISYILLDWQLAAFRAASYFYRPLYWSAGCWHFGIYARYPRRTFFYFSRPTVYVSYRGGHSWRMNGGRSYYHGLRDHYRRPADSHFGMRDRFNDRNDRFDRNNNNRIERQNDRLNRRNDRLNRQNNRLERQNNRLNRQNDRLERQNDWLERQNNRISSQNNRISSQNRIGRSDRSSSTRVTVNRDNTPSRSNSSFSRSSSSPSRSSSIGNSGSRSGGSSRSGNISHGGSRRM